MKVPTFLYVLTNLCCYVFLILTIQVSVKWYLIVVFICLSLMTDDTDHLVMCLLAIWVSSLEKYLFRSFAQFFIFNRIWFFRAVLGSQQS